MLKTRYRIDIGTFNAMLFDQAGHCFICDSGDEDLVGDHDHTTGKVRALLCRQCNGLIGMADEDTWRFFAAVQYLELFDSSIED
jgi:hypothetical protein